VIALFAALALGAALGLTSVWLAVRSGVAFGAVRAGPWVAYPRAAGLDRDPYAAALVARSGQTPLDIAEGVAFVALADSDGRALDGACEYRVSGAVPRARFWTLAATDARGALSDNPAGRHGFTSTELVRDEAGAFQVSVSPQARAGNWLPTTGLRRVALALRLYDASVSAGAAALKASDLPRIEKAGCG
jgi:hypothetical protein